MKKEVLQALQEDVSQMTIYSEQWTEELALLLRDDSELKFDYLACVSATDYIGEGEFVVSYFLYSIALGHRIHLRINLPRAHPRLMTGTKVWSTADYQERELYDLLGIIFVGHHNLQRILLDDDWEGYPLRKDYIVDKKALGLD